MLCINQLHVVSACAYTFAKYLLLKIKVIDFLSPSVKQVIVIQEQGILYVKNQQPGPV
jgi:hypothetical protein